MNKKDKIVIIGFGISGVEAMKLARQKGYEVFVYDDYLNEDDLNKKASQDEYGYQVLTLDELKNTDDDSLTFIVSPGVDCRKEHLRFLKNKTVVSEVFWAMRFNESKTIAVTGTNGKSTVCALIEHMLGDHGFKAIACGNFGIPLSQVMSDPEKKDWIKVVELSSFQLEHGEKTYFDMTVCLDITEDHLNRYESFKDYEDSKLKLFQDHSPDSYKMIDSRVIDRHEELGSLNSCLKLIYPYRIEGDLNLTVSEQGIDGDIRLDLNLKDTVFEYRHNQMNLLISVLSFLKLTGCEKISKESIQSFQGLSFRMQKVHQSKDLLVYNDSKSSSPDSTMKAMDCVNEKCVILMGGRNKHSNFGILRSRLDDHGHQVILFGESASEIKNMLHPYPHVKVYESLEVAVDSIFEWIETERIILFSPGCESFDEFSGYAERGHFFNKKINQLINDLLIKKGV